MKKSLEKAETFKIFHSKHTILNAIAMIGKNLEGKSPTSIILKTFHSVIDIDLQYEIIIHIINEGKTFIFLTINTLRNTNYSIISRYIIEV